MPSLAQLVRPNWRNGYGAPATGGGDPYSPTAGTTASANAWSAASPFASSLQGPTYGAQKMPTYGSNYGGGYGGYGGFSAPNHNRPNSNWMNPTYGAQMQQVGQETMAPTIANAQANAQKAIAGAGFMQPGPTGAAAEWQNKYGNYVQNLTGSYTGPDTGNQGVLSQKNSPLFKMISNGLSSGKSVADMEKILTENGYVPGPGPYGWVWGGSGPEPTMAQIYANNNPLTQKFNPFSAGDPNANAASLYQP